MAKKKRQTYTLEQKAKVVLRTTQRGANSR